MSSMPASLTFITRSGAISKDDLKAVCNDMKVDISDADLDEIIAR